MELRYYTDDLSKITIESLLELYDSVGWTSYTSDPEKLYEAVKNSDFLVTCFSGNRMVGLARSLSDNVAIHYIQDILVHPDFHRRGIGREMVKKCLERYKNVRMHHLMTDDRPEQKEFYRSLGFINISDTDRFVLNGYVKLKDQ